VSQAERVEILVLGSGAGGKLLSWDMARAGRRTAVVERKWIGASCPNINCRPSKNEVRSAEVVDVVRRAGALGTAAARRDDILGFTMFGADAGEVMAVVQTAMLGGMPYTSFLTHPTISEGLGSLFARVPG
jgi:pyruvate/2-oxoglutarate dehydrogenase complex dihydrolipoamide dehydrogenase (E3) component